MPHCGQRGTSGAPHWPQNRIPGGFSNWHCPHVIIARDYSRECTADIWVTFAPPRAPAPVATSPLPPRISGEERGAPTPVGPGRRRCAGSVISAGWRAVKVCITPVRILPGDASSRHERGSFLRPSRQQGRSREKAFTGRPCAALAAHRRGDTATAGELTVANAAGARSGCTASATSSQPGTPA